MSRPPRVTPSQADSSPSPKLLPPHQSEANPNNDAPDLPEADQPEEESDESEADIELDLSAAEDEAEAQPNAVQTGVEIIRMHMKDCPTSPGVYRMIGSTGEVLYVGKARNIRKRVASYTRTNGHSNRIARMISLTQSMIFVSTQTETEALLLEANYIKQMKPRFNVLMRDDKSFPYILLSADHPAPQLVKHRGARNRKGDYFGPFANTWAVNHTLNALQRAFLLRSCSDTYFENRTRPCLQHQIKRCAGPCTNEIPPQDYQTLVDEARDFLNGKSLAVRNTLAKDMTQAADHLEFERAARLRDRIAALSSIQGSQGINPRNTEEADVFAIVEEAGHFCIEVFFFRTYQNWGNKAYFPRADRSLTAAEVLDSFLAQFYADKPPARLILLSQNIETRDLLAQALTVRAGHKIEILVPQRGERRELVEHAEQNGKEALARKLSDQLTQERLLAALAQAFGIDRKLRRIEVYDNSHIMGTHAVGGMIVAGPGGFMKAHYRTFNIKSTDITPGDDYGMMREVLRRRFLRLTKTESTTDAATNPVIESSETDDSADPDVFPSRPDLILIDGGRGQFEAARSILEELGINDVELASIAKGPDRNAGREDFYLPGRPAFKLAPRDPALYFVQRLRDEAHRFAIGTHRARRKKDFTKNPLDEIVGIGPVRKRALLHAFGTAKAISRASLADLEKVPGINAASARLIFDHFNPKA